VAAFFVVLHLVLLLQTAAVHSAAFDEVVYPTSGYAYLTTGDYRMNPEHPPFLKLWTGVAWLGTGLSAPATPGWVEGDQWRFGRAMLYAGPEPPSALLFRARVMIALLSTALCVSVAFVAYRLAGPAAAIGAGFLYTLDPLMLGHGSLATTDAGAAAFYFGAALAIPWATMRGGPWRILVAGALLGLALASKFSALPLLAVLAFVPGFGGRLARWKRTDGFAERNEAVPDASTRWLRATTVGILASLVVVLSYGSWGPLPYLQGILMLGHHGEVGHPSYALGVYGTHGWWWFFPAGWLLKTPVPILAASAAGVILAVRRFRDRPTATAVAVLAPALLVAAAVTSSINLGIRHLLPLTPFLALAGGVAVAAAWRSGWIGRVGVGVGALWLAIGVLGNHPHHLSYGNMLAGGPSGVWTQLSDSNVDWGQDLPALAEAVGEEPVRTLYLSYFGTADPAAHGLVYRWVPGMGMGERRFDDGPDPAGREWLAISTTNLLGIYTDRKDAWAWLREREMTALPGNSIALYDVTGDAEAHRTIGETAMRFGDAEAAEGPLLRACELAPGDPASRYHLARVLADLGRADEGAARCREGERLSGRPHPDDLCARIEAVTVDQ
jgi:hypothetical protein